MYEDLFLVMLAVMFVTHPTKCKRPLIVTLCVVTLCVALNQGVLYPVIGREICFLSKLIFFVMATAQWLGSNTQITSVDLSEFRPDR